MRMIHHIELCIDQVIMGCLKVGFILEQFGLLLSCSSSEMDYFLNTFICFNIISFAQLTCYILNNFHHLASCLALFDFIECFNFFFFSFFLLFGAVEEEEEYDAELGSAPKKRRTVKTVKVKKSASNKCAYLCCASDTKCI